MTQAEIQIRECTSLDELADCVELQREVFGLPEAELSPVRHLIVTINAGGFVLGAYDGQHLAGFVLSVPAFLRDQRAFYSHMTGVRPEYQSHGVGSKLKWAQRDKALAMNVNYIKWTFEPVKSRNAFFNLEKLGATVSEYRRNFYGTDHASAPMREGHRLGLASDRLFADWDLSSERVAALAAGARPPARPDPTREIAATLDWSDLLERDPKSALEEQMRLRREFEAAFAIGLIARGFRRDGEHPAFLLYGD